MRRNIAMKWAKALRSGEYKQTEGQLRGDNGFCCLGVLCNLHAQEHPKIAEKEISPCTYMGEDTALPEAVIEWAGIQGGGYCRFPSTLRPKYRFPDSDKDDKDQIGYSMTDLNDEAKWDFKKIAAFIRKNYFYRSETWLSNH